MADKQDLNPENLGTSFRLNAIRKLNLRPYISGLLPLFLIAHFGHHGVAAMRDSLMPMIRTNLGLNLTQTGFLMTAFSLTSSFSQLPAGWLADRVGARMMVLLGVTGVAIGGFLFGFSNSFTMLVIFSILSALLGGGYHPAAATAISSSVPAENRGRALGIHLIGGTASNMLMPLLVAPVAAIWGWRMPFKAFTVPIAILGILLYIFIGKRVRVLARRQRQAGSEEPIGPTAIQWGTLVPFMVLAVLDGTVIQTARAFFPFYAVDELFVPEATIPLFVAIPSAVGMFAAPLGGYISDRFGSMKVILMLSFIIIPLLYLMGKTPNVAVFVIMMIVIGFVSSTRSPTAESYIVGNTPEHRRSTMLGIYFFTATEMNALLAPIFGYLIDRVGYQQTYAWFSYITVVVTVACALFLWKNRTRNKYPEMTS